MAIQVRPVTPARWADFQELFQSKGCPHYCWCMPYRDRKSHEMDKAQRKNAMRKRVRQGVPVGVLAYDGKEPIGWCSAAPRESYEKLERSTSMPRQSTKPTWTILCLFVKRSHRGQGVPARLVEGAIPYARRKGAQEVEAYPYDTAGITSRHRGHSGLYQKAGFLRDGRRWVRKTRGDGPAHRRLGGTSDARPRTPATSAAKRPRKTGNDRRTLRGSARNSLK
jgi:GNAT superfamily N-acetyltransferase